MDRCYYWTEQFVSEIFNEIRRCYRIVFTSSEFWEMGWCNQRNYRPITEIFFRSTHSWTIPKACMEETNSWWVIEKFHKKLLFFDWPTDEHKLTENCITEFVDCLKPIAFQAIYSRVNPSDVGKLFKHLADLRPDVIIPGVIDRVYATLDSLTEPHKMTAALQCLVSVSRALVSGHNGLSFVIQANEFA